MSYLFNTITSIAWTHWMKQFLIIEDEIVLFSAFFGQMFEFTRERIKVAQRVWHQSMCFRIMHIVSKFQLIIHIFTREKLTNKNRNVKNGAKGAWLLRLFPSRISQWINKLPAPYLRQNNANYLVYHMSKNIATIKTLNARKHEKSRVNLFCKRRLTFRIQLPALGLRWARYQCRASSYFYANLSLRCCSCENPLRISLDFRFEVHCSSHRRVACKRVMTSSYTSFLKNIKKTICRRILWLVSF